MLTKTEAIYVYGIEVVELAEKRYHIHEKRNFWFDLLDEQKLKYLDSSKSYLQKYTRCTSDLV